MKKTLSEIYKLYDSNNRVGSDKGTTHDYIKTYEKLFTKCKNVNLIEIGVNSGHSLKMWSEFFENSTIIGVDINSNSYMFKDDKNIIFKQGDATKEDILKSLPENIQFDYIIDDGSHMLQDQINTFKIFIKRLKPDGIYIIEDIQNFEAEFQYFIQLKKMYNLDLTIVDTRHGNINDDILMIYTFKNGK